MKMRDVGTKDEVLRISKVFCIGAILFMGLLFNVQLLAGMTDIPSEGVVSGSPLDRLRHITLQDAVPFSEEGYGSTPVPEYQPLEVHVSDDPSYEYMAVSPYYTVYLKGNTVKMSFRNGTWIECELEYMTVIEESEGKQHSEEVKALSAGESVTDQNMLSVSDVFESVDMSYTADTSLLREELVLEEFKQCTRIVQTMQWENITPEYQEDGSILFFNENREKIVAILPPFMEDAAGNICEDIHYELVETETGYELHKVIDEKGLEWLQHAVYPVILDPSMQTFEDAWESSGLTPFGQYFQSLTEYVNPANGQLTITQTDLSIPGRGLDLVITRVYEMPALFYEMSPYMGQDPYDYEEPPVDVGKGWQLDFPYVGQQYLHLWGGTFYKIDWSNNTFVNHKGAHFVLIKNGDNTYTLTTAGGIVYAFSTTGEVTSITDLDQNTITFSYTSGVLTSITDTIGRTVSLSYSGGRLWKISYNGNELEYSYDSNGCLLWMEDFLNRRTSYYYNTGYNSWLLSKIVYVTTGYTTYMYDRFSDGGYYRYHVTHQRVYDTNQVRHIAYSYTGSFEEITGSTMVVKNESDINQGYYECTIDNNMITQRVTRNPSGTPIRKMTFAYNSRNEVTEQSIYNDGANLSYTTYYGYDNWGNVTYLKDAEGHEKFFSYANTSTSGFFMDNTDNIIRTFSNAFSNSTVPSSVHTALIGAAEKQDSTFVKEVYITYDSESHPTQNESAFGNATTWLTFSGTFNEKTGQTSFPIDLTGHTVAGNGVLQITGLPSDDNYQESHSYSCEGQCNANCKSVSGSWQGGSYKLNYKCCRYQFGEVVCAIDKTTYISSFVHYPGTLGYQSYSTVPGMNQMFTTFLVKTFWKAYPAEVQYNLDQSAWKTVTSKLTNGTGQVTVPITDGTHTLYLSESSSYQTKFSWDLYVPVDNALDTYSTSMAYDTYGNVTTVTDAESDSINLSYSSTYSGAYLTEISATVGQDTITARATYDCYRGWVTSIQDPKGVALDSGYDYLFSHDALGRVTKKEFPLLTGQSQRSYLEAVYDDTNRTTSIIDQLRHYSMRKYDKLGRLTDVRWYTGIYGSGTLYATESYTYRYDNCLLTTTDPGGHVYSRTYDFLGRAIQVIYPDSSTTSFSYDDTFSKITETNGRGYDRIYWHDWLGQLIKVEQEYATNSFAVTTYQYDELGHLTSFTDAEDHTTSYTFASLFGVTRITYPDSTCEQYEYDSAGRTVAFTDGKGSETLYTYDSINRMIQVQYPDLSTVSFTYDLNSNSTEMEDNAPESGDFVEHEFDEWNRLISETRHMSQNAYTTSYQYDVGSRLTGLIYPDSMQVLYSYDDLNRVTEVKRYVDGSNDEILMNNAQYNTEGQVTQFDYGNGLQAHFSYDSRDRITAIDVKDDAIPFLDLSYSYDNTGNIAQIVNGWRDCSSAWHTDTESYGYDGLDRISSATCTSWFHAFSYDRAGNRTEKDGITYYINDVNEVTSLSDGTTFTYDENGNRIQKTQGNDTWTYAYDYCNRLTEVEENSVTLAEYKYDGSGKRIQATEDDITTTYFYSGHSVLLEETPTGTVSYIYGPVGKLAKRTTMEGESHTYFYHTDKLGSCRLVTDEDKNIISATTFHPFGGMDIHEGSEHPLYTDKEMDSTGLYYYGARYYDPEIGRFLTRDTSTGRIAAPQSLNRYSYVLNNPTKFVDSNGCGENIPYMEADNKSPRRGTLTGLLGGTLTVGAPGLLILIAFVFPASLLVVALVMIAFAASGLAILLQEDGTEWQEDLDGDGDWETVVEYKDKTGQLTRLEIETDGTTIKKLYRINGDLINTWMLIPDSENPEGYIIYVWDEKSQEWLLDQDQDGIPDSTEEAESSGESGNSSNNSGSSNSNDQSAPTEPNQPY